MRKLSKEKEAKFKQIEKDIKALKTSTAKKIMNGIVKDFSDRKGLRYEWEAIDTVTKKEIKKEWLRIIIKEL